MKLKIFSINGIKNLLTMSYVACKTLGFYWDALKFYTVSIKILSLN